MGYTHYWTAHRAHPAYALAWKEILHDARRILDAVGAQGIRVTGPSGTGRPRVDAAGGIAFNGDAAANLAYESFHLVPPTHEAGNAWAFCKTERRPYDLAVTAVLLRARLLLPDAFGIDSDGRWDHDWADARRLIGELFGPVPTADPFTLQLPPDLPYGDPA